MRVGLEGEIEQLAVQNGLATAGFLNYPAASAKTFRRKSVRFVLARRDP
jgi:hypothetical protein